MAEMHDMTDMLGLPDTSDLQSLPETREQAGLPDMYGVPDTLGLPGTSDLQSLPETREQAGLPDMYGVPDTLGLPGFRALPDMRRVPGETDSLLYADGRRPVIFIVEDDVDLALLYARMLLRLGCDTLIANSVSQARAYAQTNSPDLYMLDVVLPDGDGIALCKEFRRLTDAPILFLSGKNNAWDKAEGMEAGGDYYLTKPYEKIEFVSVVRSLLRRAERTKKRLDELSSIERGPLVLKLTAGQAYVHGRDTELTPKEFAVLLMLVQNEGRELSGEAIYRNVWGKAMCRDTGIIRKHISQIKKKLDTDNTDEFAILTEYRGGYMFTTE